MTVKRLFGARDGGNQRFTADAAGNLHDAATGDFEGFFQHPRKGSKYQVATVLQEWAMEKYTPDVTIKTVRTEQQPDDLRT